MTAIVYTAKREIVLNGFNKSGTDISIASADNSINATSTDLSGMLQDEWIILAGSAVDDGQHQVASDSIATKILTQSALTNESIGSLITITGYEHGVGEEYELETVSHVMDRGLNTEKKQATSISGIKETIRYRKETFWDILTDFITEAEMVYWDEFVASVDGGESFTLDVYGSIATPDNPVSVTMEGDPIVIRVGDAKLYQLSFKVKVI